MGQAGDALACCRYLVQIYHSPDYPNLITAIGKDFAPGVDDQRVAITCAAARDLTDGAGRYNKSPVLYSSRSVENMPMGLPGLLRKSSWNKQNFGA